MSPSSFLTSAAYVNVFAFSVASLPASSAKYTLLYGHSCHCRQPLQKCQTLIQKFSSFQQRCLRKTKALACVKPVLNWATVCSPNILRTVRRTMIRFLTELLVRRTLLRSQLACNKMQASARTCGRRAADSMIENAG